MKKLILTCAFLASASFVFAQNQATPQTPNAAPNAVQQQHPMPPQMTAEQRAERRAKMEEKQYGLTPEQYKSVYAEELDMMKKQEETRTSGRQMNREQMEAINKNRDEKFKKILTPEQYAKYDAMRNRQQPHPAMAPGAKQQVAPQPQAAPQPKN